MRAVSDVYPEVRLEVNVDDKTSNVPVERAKVVTEAARKVNGELKKQLDVRNLKVSLDEEGQEGNNKLLCTSNCLMKDMKECCRTEGLGLTLSAGHLGYVVRVADWKNKGGLKKVNKRQRSKYLNVGPGPRSQGSVHESRNQVSVNVNHSTSKNME